mgnify:CR=1 FL=1
MAIDFTASSTVTIISGVFRPKLGNYSDDLGDNVAGTMDNDRVSDLYTHVL